jgi:hypothetical protein
LLLVASLLPSIRERQANQAKAQHTSHSHQPIYNNAKMKIIHVLNLLYLAIAVSARSSFRISNNALLHARGGDEEAQSTGSYHGNYVSPINEVPKVAQTQVDVATPPPQVAPQVQAVLPVTTQSSKLSNFQERAPPALLMLGATYLLLHFLRQKGLIGLVLVMQWAMYSESTSVVSEHYKGKDASDGQIVSFGVQKWWWFLTALVATSGRYVISCSILQSQNEFQLHFLSNTSSFIKGVCSRNYSHHYQSII